MFCLSKIIFEMSIMGWILLKKIMTQKIFFSIIHGIQMFSHSHRSLTLTGPCTHASSVWKKQIVNNSTKWHLEIETSHVFYSSWVITSLCCRNEAIQDPPTCSISSWRPTFRLSAIFFKVTCLKTWYHKKVLLNIIFTSRFLILRWFLMVVRIVNFEIRSIIDFRKAAESWPMRVRSSFY